MEVPGVREVTGGQQRALSHWPRPYLLTLGPADHEGVALPALGWAPQPPQPVGLGRVGQRPLPEGAA